MKFPVRISIPKLKDEKLDKEFVKFVKNLTVRDIPIYKEKIIHIINKISYKDGTQYFDNKYHTLNIDIEVGYELYKWLKGDFRASQKLFLAFILYKNSQKN